MIQPIDFQTNDIIGFRMSGKINQDEIKPWVARLDQKSDEPGKLRVYIEYEDVDEVTTKAIFQDLKFDLTHLSDFAKVALVSDKTWTSVPAFLANLFPDLNTRQFPIEQKEEARQWVKS